jgi:hypothetical protein
LFLVVTKLLVLDRLMDFSKLKSGRFSSRWTLFERALFAVVFIGIAAGFVGNIVSAALIIQAADTFAGLGSGNNSSTRTTVPRRETFLQARIQVSQATKAASFYVALECITLLLVIFAFCVAGAASIRRIRDAFRSSRIVHAAPLTPMRADGAASAPLSVSTTETAATSSKYRLQRQILGTCSVVFFSFLIRAVYAGVFVIANIAQNVDENCVIDGAQKRTDRINSEANCRPCGNIYTNILVTLLYTPQLYFAVALISQPVVLLVALWGMTSGQTLRLMKAKLTVQ